MASIALFLLKSGCKVCGSDIKASLVTDALCKEGCKIYIGHNAEHLQVGSTVIYSSAIGEDNVELKRAKLISSKIFTRAEFLSVLSANFDNFVGVAGCHGKTTTTAMLANIVNATKLGFLSHIGGEDLNLGSLHYTGRDVFISEICEFKRNIDLFSPSVGVVVSSGYDHADCYNTPDELNNVFYDYLNRSKISVVNGDDLILSKFKNADITFGFSKKFTVCAMDVSYKESGASFNVFVEGKNAGRFYLRSSGRYNVYNSLAAISAAHALNIDFKHIKKGLSSYRGVKRRFETVGQINGATVVCDYAHHPAEISACLAGIQSKFKRLHVVFQPHTYSRTKALFYAFIDVLKCVDDLVIYKTYAAREEYDAEGDAYRLFCEMGGDCVYAQSPVQLKNHLLGKTKRGDLILVLGAGDIYEIVKSIVNEAYQ